MDLQILQTICCSSDHICLPHRGFRDPESQTSKGLQKHVYLFKLINLLPSGHHLWATFMPHWTQRIFLGVCIPWHSSHGMMPLWPHCFQKNPQPTSMNVSDSQLQVWNEWEKKIGTFNPDTTLSLPTLGTKTYDLFTIGRWNVFSTMWKEICSWSPQICFFAY